MAVELIFPRPAVLRSVALAACLLLLFVFRAHAAGTPRQVFLTDGSQLNFINVLTGDMQTTAVNGERFTIVGDSVMFFDRSTRRVMLAAPGGTPRPHPFVQLGEDASRVDWLLTPDGQSIVWTETTGAPTALMTTTRIARLDGADERELFTDGARDGIRAYPVAFSDDQSNLYMDYQPNTIGDLTPFRQYAGLFALNLETGETSALPGEPGCFCGAGIDAGVFLRLAAANGGFSLRIQRLSTGSVTTLNPVNSFTQGGDVLIAPDGTRAVYALAQITGFGTASQSVQTVIVLVDLLNLSQRPLGAPSDRLLRPLMWTEDDSAVLFADPQSQTTWKATVADGALDQVANGVYLGTLVSS